MDSKDGKCQIEVDKDDIKQLFVSFSRDMNRVQMIATFVALKMMIKTNFVNTKETNAFCDKLANRILDEANNNIKKHQRKDD